MGDYVTVREGTEMDILSFTSQVAAAGDDLAIRRWSAQFVDVVASHTVQLARYIDVVPEHLISRYVDVVIGALEHLPEDSQLVVAPTVYENLRRIWPPDRQPLLEARLAMP
jgi:hypothetical protein